MIELKSRKSRLEAIESPLKMRCTDGRGREGVGGGSPRWALLRNVVAVLAAVTLVSACAASDDGSKDQSDPKQRSYQEGMVSKESGGEPVQGGTLNIAAYQEPKSLDPAVTTVTGVTGGTELAAIYDVLMRYDAGSEEYLPQLAESLTPNKDFSEWTLKLRDGVQFTDGTTLDSAAVKWSQERYLAAPGSEAPVWADSVQSIETPDERTVVYQLTAPWSMFPSLLSTGPGMIVAKSADSGAEFTPVGVGPFVLEKWAPQEELVLAANKDYWDGRPSLDKVRSVFLSDQQTAIDSLKNGSVDAAFVRDPDKVDTLLEEGTAGYLNLLAASNVAIINAKEGHAGSDPRVRQAMAMAINPELIRERAYGGHGVADSTLFPDYSRWHGQTEGLPYDPEQAKRLLEAAKADGYDGKVHYVDASDPASRAIALAVKASLENVGFAVETDLKRTVPDLLSAVSVNGDYDVAGWGLGYREGDPVSRMLLTLSTEGPQRLGMAATPELDGLLAEFRGESDAVEQAKTMDRIQQQLNEQVPFLNWGPIAEFYALSGKVHGVLGTTSTIVLLNEAWVG